MVTLKSPFADLQAVYSQGSDIKPIERYLGYFVRLDITKVSNSALTFVSATDVNASTDEIAEPSHGYLTGLVGQMSTDGTLPTGLSTSTDYYIIKIDDDTYKLASSLQNAIDGVAVDLTDAGVGNQTFTPLSLAGAEVKLQGSHLAFPTEDTDWEDVTDCGSVEGSTVKSWNVSGAYYHKMRYYVTLTSGQLDIEGSFTTKGPQWA